MRWIILFLIIMTAQLVYATNTVYISEEWKAGTIQIIKVETEINYDTSKIIITGTNKTILLNSSMDKKDIGVFSTSYFIPSNAKADIYKVKITLDKNYYPEFSKTIEIRVIELNFFDRFLLFLRTHLSIFQ